MTLRRNSEAALHTHSLKLIQRLIVKQKRREDSIHHPAAMTLRRNSEAVLHPHSWYMVQRKNNKTKVEGRCTCPKPGYRAVYTWLKNLHRHLKAVHHRHIDGRPASPSTVERAMLSSQHRPSFTKKQFECPRRINSQRQAPRCCDRKAKK